MQLTNIPKSLSKESMTLLENLRNDLYVFSWADNKTFGSRIRRWREMNHLDREELAKIFFLFYSYVGRKEISIDSMVHKIGDWEKKNDDITAINFNLLDLSIYKTIINCDYEFLLCEIDTPHKFTNDISRKTGLSFSAVESLFRLDNELIINKNSLIKELSDSKKKAINMIVSDKRLMELLSFFFSSYITTVESQTASIFMQVNANSSGIISNAEITLDYNEQLESYKLLFCSEFTKLKETYIAPFQATQQQFLSSLSAPSDLGIGYRLEKWRKEKSLTQSDVATLLLEHSYCENDSDYLASSVLRTYQNWESKKSSYEDSRINLGDLKKLRSVLNCDYDYLLFNFNSDKVFFSNPQQDSILDNDNINVLESISNLQDNNETIAKTFTQALNTIISDDELLTLLAYYLTDLPITFDAKESYVILPNLVDAPEGSIEREFYNRLTSDNSHIKSLLLNKIYDIFVSSKEKIYSIAHSNNVN